MLSIYEQSGHRVGSIHLLISPLYIEAFSACHTNRDAAANFKENLPALAKRMAVLGRKVHIFFSYLR
jgi:hypothetical protein